MDNLSSFLSEHRKREKLYIFILFVLFSFHIICNLVLTYEVINAGDTNGFIQLLSSQWLKRTLIGNCVLEYTMHFYSTTNILLFVLRCLRLQDLLLFFSSLFYWMQWSQDKQFNTRKKLLTMTWVFLLIALISMLGFIVLAANSMTTASAFFLLVVGAISYAILNGLALVCVLSLLGHTIITK